MPEAVLIFTFSPVQSFIMQARRAADLFAGSRILVELAKAAAMTVQGRGGKLIFPAFLGDDVPNKVVAIAPAEQVRPIAADARTALLQKWEEIAASARQRLRGYNAGGDGVWEAIWRRQTGHLWEVYWASAPMSEGGQAYAAAYRWADTALNAAKRTRAFDAAEEPELKDSLSGQRQALRTSAKDARNYFAALAQQVGAAKLGPEGSERLDAIAAIKRFCDIAEKDFPSTSSVASEDFREEARGQLKAYRRAIENLIPGNLPYRVRRSDPEWPYDGDLLYGETLTPRRLEDSYGLKAPAKSRLEAAQSALRQLYRQTGRRPSPYYAVVALDGDAMGQRISSCLTAGDPRQEHENLSKSLANFAGAVKRVTRSHLASVVYNGGDDVLLMVPVNRAIAVAEALAKTFAKTTKGTASAGIAIAHHLYPLDAVLAAARDAEQAAKHIYGRDAVCVRAIKRSGESLQVGSHWSAGGADLDDTFTRMVDHLQNDRLSSRFTYELAEQAPTVSALGSAAWEAVLNRLVKRHKTDRMSVGEAKGVVNGLRDWARGLGTCVPGGDAAALSELGRWLVLAHFVAQGGDE